MVERQEVEALLALANLAGPRQRECAVASDTLAALCRAWLAVQDAPAVEVRECFGTPAPYLDTNDMDAAVAQLRPGQRVRIVPDHEEDS